MNTVSESGWEHQTTLYDLTEKGLLASIGARPGYL